MNDWRQHPTASVAEFKQLHSQIQNDMDALQDEEEAASWALTHWNEPLLLHLLPQVSVFSRVQLLWKIHQTRPESLEQYLDLAGSTLRGLLARIAVKNRQLSLFRRLAGRDKSWDPFTDAHIIGLIRFMPDSTAAEYIWTLLNERTIHKAVQIRVLTEIGPISRVAVWISGRDLDQTPSEEDWRHPGVWWFRTRRQTPPDLRLPLYQALGAVIPSSLARYLHHRL